MPVKSTHAQWSKIRESPRDWRVIRWLRKKPVPAYVEGEDAEGEVLRVELVGKVGERPHWADATRALHDCEKLTAHNAGGGILRVLEHDADDAELVAEKQREDARRAGAVELVAGSSPILSIDVPRLVKEIAESMERVANGAAEQQAKAHSEAFKQMGNVITIAMNLLVRLERELDAATSRSEPESSDPKDVFVQAAIQKAFGGGAPTNGAGGFDLAKIMSSVSPQQIQEFMALMNGGAQPNDDGADNGGH